MLNASFRETSVIVIPCQSHIPFKFRHAARKSKARIPIFHCSSKFNACVRPASSTVVEYAAASCVPGILNCCTYMLLSSGVIQLLPVIPSAGHAGKVSLPFELALKTNGPLFVSCPLTVTVSSALPATFGRMTIGLSPLMSIGGKNTVNVIDSPACKSR